MMNNRLRTLLMVGMCVFALTAAFLVVTEGTVLSEDDTSFSRAADVALSSSSTTEFSSTSFSNDVVESDNPYLGTSAAEVVNQAGIDRLVAATGGEAKVDVSWVTGLVSFIQLPQGVTLAYDAASPEDAAMAFFADYGDLFAITSAENELALIKSTVDARGFTRLSFQQVYEGVAVFGATLQVSVTPENEIASVNGNFIPVSDIATVPALGADEAAEIAMELVRTLPRESHVVEDNAELDPMASRSTSPVAMENAFEIGELSVATNLLYVYHDGLLMGVPGQLHLAYEVQVVNEFLTIRDFLIIDAISGELINKWEAIHLINREVYESNLSTLVWQEGDPDPIPANWNGGDAAQVTAWQNEIDGAVETYNMFASMTGGAYLSYDGLDATMKTVNNDPNINCPNANWNGVSTNYCNGVTGDDTVAHEWGHAYTEYNSNLIYQWQSGALNESYSDVWGEVVDMLNGRGTDSPDTLRTDACSIYGAGSPSTDDSYRWLSGEDDPAFGGAIRDMWNPGCYGDPNQVIDSNYYCASTDGGGVHSNSGVPNRTFAVMVDGLPSQSIPALGLTKSAHIFWHAQVNYLIESSNFADFAGAIEQSCQDLIGVNLNQLTTGTSGWGNPSGEVITPAECQTVEDITALLQLRTSPAEQCGFEPLLAPDAPVICEALGNVETISLEDWESGNLGAWTADTRDVANPATFDEEDWAVVSDLPAERPGSAAFVGNDPALGNCADDDESGVLYLESPVFNLPNDPLLVPRIAIDHYVATELGWDGGNIKVSINGGDWELLPAAAFEFNPYNANLQSAGAGNTNPLAGEPAYTGTDEGDVSGSWGRSYVNLAGIAFGGDTVQLRFEEGQDGCNGVIGWFVDDVHVYSCELESLGMSCGDGILDAGETCDDGNTANGDGCSNVCLTESNYTCSTPVPPQSGPMNVVPNGDFELGAVDWNEYSTNGGGAVPGSLIDQWGLALSGTYHVWFGGWSDYELAVLDQDVAIPADATDLTFSVLRGLCDSDDDYLALRIDDDLVWFTVCDAEDADYVEYTVDVTSYAGGTHNLWFQSETVNTNGSHSNFFMDDVEIIVDLNIPGEPSVCEPNPEIDINPDSVYSYQYPDQVKVKQFSISNVGAGVLEWQISEDNKLATTLVPGYATDVPEVTEPAAVEFTGAVSKVSSLPKSGNAVPGATIETASGLSVGSGGGTAADGAGVLEPGYYLFTESAALTPIADNSAACGYAGPDGRITTENWYLRQFDLINDFDVTSSVDIDRLYFGVEAVNLADMEVYLIVSITDDLTLDSILGGLVNVNLLTLPQDLATGLYYIDIAPLHIPAGSTIVYGMIVFEGDGAFYAGSNDAGEAGPSYLAAPGCGINQPIPTAGIGFPGMNLTLHYLAQVNDDFLTCTYPEDVPWITDFSPVSGSTAAGNSDSVDVTFDSTGYGPGIYEATLCVESNDKTDPLVQVPVIMEVVDYGSVAITKYEDVNGNAERDAGEPGVEGWDFALLKKFGWFWLPVDGVVSTDVDGNASYTGLLPGTYMVCEERRWGWVNTDPVDSINLFIADCQQVSVSDNQVTPAVFGNYELAKIKIVKDAQPNSSNNFKFYSSFGSFWLDDDNRWPLNNAVTVSYVSPGTYYFTEKDARGWELEDIVCESDASIIDVNLGASTVNISPASGDDVTCTFINKKTSHGGHGHYGSLTVHTTVDWRGIRPRASQDFKVCIYGNTTGAYSCATVNSTGGKVVFNNLAPDTYSWWQVNPGTNWSVSGWGTAPVDLSKGGEAVVGINNTFLIPDATFGNDNVDAPADTSVDDDTPTESSDPVTGPRGGRR